MNICVVGPSAKKLIADGNHRRGWTRGGLGHICHGEAIADPVAAANDSHAKSRGCAFGRGFVEVPLAGFSLGALLGLTYWIWMKFSAPLEPAILLRRYKRFLADVQFSDGVETTVHCPNPGAMLGVAPTGARCWVSRSDNKARKLPLTLEIVECQGPTGMSVTGINTNLPNKLAEEALRAGLIRQIPCTEGLRREVRYGEEKSRVDLFLPGPPDTYIEIKNCHLLRREDGVAEFPDCVTARGLKHLRELGKMVSAGHRAVLLFVIQRSDAVGFSPADDIDPAYGEGLRKARDEGVEILAYDCIVSPEEIRIRSEIETYF